MMKVNYYTTATLPLLTLLIVMSFFFPADAIPRTRIDTVITEKIRPVSGQSLNQFLNGGTITGSAIATADSTLTPLMQVKNIVSDTAATMAPLVHGSEHRFLGGDLIFVQPGDLDTSSSVRFAGLGIGADVDDLFNFRYYGNPFKLTYTDGRRGLWLKSAPEYHGVDSLTPGIIFSTGIGFASICGRQYSVDNDVIGIDFYTHPTSSSSDPSVLALQLNKDGEAIFYHDIFTKGNTINGVKEATTDSMPIPLMQGLQIVSDSTANKVWTDEGDGTPGMLTSTGEGENELDTTNIKVSVDTTFFPGWLTWHASVALPTIGTKYSNQPFVIATGGEVADPDSGPHLAMFPINSPSNGGKVRFASANNVDASIDLLTNALRWYYDPSEASTSTPNFQITPNTITGNGPLLISGTGAIEMKGSESDNGVIIGEVIVLGDKTKLTNSATKNSIASNRTIYAPTNDTIATIDLDSLAVPYEYTYIMQHTETGGAGYDTIKINESDSLLDGNYVYVVTVGGVANQQSKATFVYSNSDGWKTIYEVYNSSALLYAVGSAEGTRIIYSYSSTYGINQTTVTVKRLLSDKEYLDSMHVPLGGLARARNGYVDIPYKINVGTTSGNINTVIDSTEILVTKNGGDTLFFIDDNDRIKSNADSMIVKGYIKSTAIFGNIGTHDDTTGTAVATGASYEKLTGFDKIGYCSRVVGDTAHDQFTFTDTGYYKLEYSLSGYCASNAIKWIFTPFLNGVEQDLGHSQSKLANANDIQNYGASTIIHVSALTSGFPLYIGVRHNSGSTETFNLTYASMVATYLGNIE